MPDPGTRKQSDTQDGPAIDAAHRGGATLSHTPCTRAPWQLCPTPLARKRQGARVHWPACAGAALSLFLLLPGWPSVLGCPSASPCTASLRTISPLPRRRSHVCAARDMSSLHPHRLAWRPLMQGCAGGQGRARGWQGERAGAAGAGGVTRSWQCSTPHKSCPRGDVASNTATHSGCPSTC